MRNDYTDITIVLDRSGSMAGTVDDTIGGYNRFVEDQRKVPGKCTQTLVQFDDLYEVNYIGMPVSVAPLLTRDTYTPRGNTALWGAMGKAIKETGARLSAMPERERPGKVLFVVITDGQENASHRCEWGMQWANRESVNGMVRHQTDRYKWEFVFIGADLNAMADAASLGVGYSNSMRYAANSVGTQSLYSSLSKKTAEFRCAVGSDAKFGFDDDDRQAQADAGLAVAAVAAQP